MLKGQKMPESTRLAHIERFRISPPNGWIGARKGMRCSEEHRRKISETKKGKPAPWARKPHSEETKRKLSVANKGRKPTPEQIAKTVGPNHWRWNPNREFVRDRRTSVEYKQWRTLVFQRDNWTCQTCGVRGVSLEPHHIKSYAKYPELRLDVSNGVTLCRPCHALTANYRGRG